MSSLTPDYGIYLVTDYNYLRNRSLYECVKIALESGVSIVQYRAKEKDSLHMYEEALTLKKLCDTYNKSFIVNDRLDIAMAVGADGVHLGQSDIPCAIARRILGNSFIIGVSAHNEIEAKKAESDGANYLGCGAVFGTSSKTGVNTLGLKNLNKICSAVSIPVVGIGGISANNYKDVLAAGAHGAAFISGILKAENIKAEVAKLLAIKLECKH